MKKEKLVSIIIFIVAALCLGEILISHHLVTAGEKLRLLEEKEANLKNEQRVLVEEIGQITSLSKISLKAQELGLVRTTQVLHLVPQLPIAKK